MYSKVEVQRQSSVDQARPSEQPGQGEGHPRAGWSWRFPRQNLIPSIFWSLKREVQFHSPSWCTSKWGEGRERGFPVVFPALCRQAAPSPGHICSVVKTHCCWSLLELQLLNWVQRETDRNSAGTKLQRRLRKHPKTQGDVKTLH